MVKIFYYDIKSASNKQLLSYLNILSDYEKARAEKFKFEKDRNLYTAGKIMTRKIIAERTGVKPEDLKFSIDEYDRPFLEYPKINNFDFNISHSGDYVVLAVSDSRVGVDIEKIKPIDLSIAENVFHEKEIEYLRKHKDDNFDSFYKIWTLKESFIKAIGQGMSYPLKDFYFDMRVPGNIKINILKSFNKDQIWNHSMFDFVLGYKLALCAQGAGFTEDTQPERFEL